MQLSFTKKKKHKKKFRKIKRGLINTKPYRGSKEFLQRIDRIQTKYRATIYKGLW